MYKNQIRYELRIKLAIKCDNKKIEIWCVVGFEHTKLSVS